MSSLWMTDKDQDRIQRASLQRERLEAQTIREKEKHQRTVEKIRETQEYRQREKESLALLDKETAISLKLLDHALEPERLDLEYNDLIRRSDIELQILQAELNIRDAIQDREHKRNLDYIYQSTLMEITKASAQILDEQNKAVAINQQEANTQIKIEAEQHKHRLIQKHQDHKQGMERDILQAYLKKGVFTHEELTRLAIRLLAKKWGLQEGEISRDDVAEWVAEFEQDS